MCRIVAVRPSPGDRVIHEYYGEGTAAVSDWFWSSYIKVYFDKRQPATGRDRSSFDMISPHELRIVGREYHPYLV